LTLFGAGRVALEDDVETADRLGWTRRRRSADEPEAVLWPRDGDPQREPWIAPPAWRSGRGVAPLDLSTETLGAWRYQRGVPGVLRDLQRLSAPAPRSWRVAIGGLGRVGGTAAAALASMPERRSGIAELLLHDGDAANLERWHLELQSVAGWRGTARLPRVRRVRLEEVFHACDVFLFAAAAGVPPVGAEGDVRYVQFEPNREILHAYLEQARRSDFAGLFLIVSDPVECLALAAFHDSNHEKGRFAGNGLAPERIAGLALGVMWGRSLACAREAGWETVARRGAAYGPHSTEVVVVDDVAHPDHRRSAALARAAREGNLELRRMGFLPFVGPALSSVALTLPALLQGREMLASVFLDGVYFGAPARLQWGVFPTAKALDGGLRRTLARAHAALSSRAHELAISPSER
jgi:hypothetical protein